MKKINKLLFVTIFVVLISPIMVNAQSELDKKWNTPIDFNDSISISMGTFDDGYVITKYEGASSSNNKIIKYDKNGNEKWSINNDSGANIITLTDNSVLIYSSYGYAKVNSSGETIYNKKQSSPLNRLIPLYDGKFASVTWASNIYIYDNNGDKINTIDTTSYLSDYDLYTYRESSSYSYTYGPQVCYMSMIDNDKYLIMLRVPIKKKDATSYYESVVFVETDKDFNKLSVTDAVVPENKSPISTNKRFYYSISLIPENVRGMAITDSSYMIATYNKMYIFNRNKNTFIKKGNISGYNYTAIDNKVYGLVFESKPNDSDTYIEKIKVYDSNINEIESYDLPLTLAIKSTSLFDNSGISSLKNFALFKIGDDGKLDITVANTPITNSAYANYSSNIDYGLINYKIVDKKENAVQPIIDKIINPETSSTTIIVLILLIASLIIGGTFIYSNKKFSKRD